MESINASDFKTRCLAILDEIHRTGQGVTVLKRGRPVAIVLPPPGSQYPQLGLFGTVTTEGDLLEPVVPALDWDCLG